MKSAILWGIMKVQTTWNCSKDTEADRLIQCAANTYNRFYLKNNFLVLPQLKNNNSALVYLPNLNYQKDQFFVKKVRCINPTDIPFSNDKKLHDKAVNFLPEVDSCLTQKRIEKMNNDWKNIEKEFYIFLGQTFPQLKKQQIHLEIRPTNFGTVTTFNISKKVGQITQIILYVRLDSSIAQVAEAVLSSHINGWLKRENRSWDDNWQENEAVIDFLMTKTKLKDMFPHYQPTLKNLRKKQLGKLVQESQKYMKKLGISVGDIFSLKNDRVLVDQKYTLTGLTEKEYRLLKFLVENKNQVCPIDTIGDILWQNEDEDAFSLWAIAKQIERLRGKFQKHGLSPTLIQSQRGQGYLLRD
jgi:DNA-binding winged helix-turn-helix (wHTH) protein